MTALAAAMRRAGIETASAELYTMMSAALIKADGRVPQAVKMLHDAVAHDSDVLTAVLTFYAEAVARDMRGRANGEPNDGALPNMDMIHRSAAPRALSPLSDGGLQHGIDAHHTYTAPVRSPVPGPRLQSHHYRQTMASAQAGTLHHAPVIAHGVRPPLQGRPIARTAVIAARIVSARTILDTLTVRDGRAIGDVQWSELREMEGTNRKEALLLAKIRRHVANAPGDALVRDVISSKVLETLAADAAREAAESDHA